MTWTIRYTGRHACPGLSSSLHVVHKGFVLQYRERLPVSISDPEDLVGDVIVVDVASCQKIVLRPDLSVPSWARLSMY